MDDDEVAYCLALRNTTFKLYYQALSLRVQIRVQYTEELFGGSKTVS